MTIETKYNIGQEVWFMKDNHAASGKVAGLRCTHNENMNTDYFIRGNFIYSGCILEEKFLFPTKEELLKSL